MKFSNRSNGRPVRAPGKRVRRLVTVGALVIVSTLFITSGPVWAAPTILPSTLPDAEVDVFYTTTLVAAPVTGSTAWQITSGSLPPGLSLNAGNGVISGTPTAVGNYAFFVDVTDDIGGSGAHRQSHYWPGMLFWYRQSPKQMLAGRYHDSFLITTKGVIRLSNPPWTVAGMVGVKLDPDKGNLRWFHIRERQGRDAWRVHRDVPRKRRDCLPLCFSGTCTPIGNTAGYGAV